MRQTHFLSISALILATLAMSACAAEDSDAIDSDEVAEAAAPALGKADGADRADKGCQVVLRHVGRVSDGSGGYETVGAMSNWIWRGEVDVAKTALSPSTQVAVIYRSSLDHAYRWLSVQAKPTGDSSSTYVRYGFAIDNYVAGPGFPGTTLSRSQIELIPYLVEPRGARLFDHNRNTHPYANYTLLVDNSWSIDQEAGTCQDRLGTGVSTGTVAIGTDDAVQDGPLVAGGTLMVHYDINKMDGCRATHNGYPFWDTRAHVRFLPGGETYDGTVREFRNHLGRPTNMVDPVAAEFAIPQKATHAEVWFRHFSHATGGVCEEWDSLDGDNYRFNVLPPPEWVGAPSLKIERGSLHPCDGASTMGDEGFLFESWARQRAAVTNICFEVYQPGVTDWDNPEMWKDLDVTVHYRYGHEGPFAEKAVDVVDRPNNNARYAWNIRSIDPFMPGNCDLKDLLVNDEGAEVFEVEYFFAINGIEVAGADGDALRGTFRGYWTYECD